MAELTRDNQELDTIYVVTESWTDNTYAFYTPDGWGRCYYDGGTTGEVTEEDLEAFKHDAGIERVVHVETDDRYWDY